MSMTGQRPLLYVLALLEAALCLLASAGQVVGAAGDPLFALPGLWLAGLYIVAGVFVARGQRWAAIILLILESLRLAAFSFSALLGLLPWVQPSITGATLLAGLVLPVSVMLLAGRVMSAKAAIA
jgi:hypothetical protein